jgi:DNA-binding transcriptional regulator YhcF (GntR family)
MHEFKDNKKTHISQVVKKLKEGGFSKEEALNGMNNIYNPHNKTREGIENDIDKHWDS